MPDLEKNPAAGEGKPGEKGAADQKGADQKGGDQVPVAALLEERGKRQSLEAKLKQFETVFGDQIQYDSVGNVIPRSQANPAQPANVQGDIRQKLDELWNTDPRQAVQAELTYALGWYDNVHASVENEMDTVAGKFKDFDQYRPFIRQYLRSIPIDQRTKPGLVEAAYYLHKGKEIDKIVESEKRSIYERIQAGESIQGITAGTGSGLPRANGVKFTPDEINAAKLYGVSPEEYWNRK